MNPWRNLARYTKARVGLGQAGGALPTAQHLALAQAQALARDALWKTWEPADVVAYVQGCGEQFYRVTTAVSDRGQYLARPDLGRMLSEKSALDLSKGRQAEDGLVLCVSDGLSAEAVQRHMIGFLKIFLPMLKQEPLVSRLPLSFVVIPFARVAAADHIGELLKSRLSVMFLGERPGLSSHDSLGIYLTHKPRRGTADGARNCISNVRPPDGLSYELASIQLCYLLRESLRRQLSGVELKMATQTELEYSILGRLP